jgi:hypothetical protein
MLAKARPVPSGYIIYKAGRIKSIAFRDELREDFVNKIFSLKTLDWASPI